MPRWFGLDVLSSLFALLWVCAAVVDTTLCSLATLDDSTLRRCRKFFNLTVEVVLDLFDSLVSALLVQALCLCF